MAKFKINIGNWTEYRADGSLAEPDNPRNPATWTANLSAGISAYGVIATTSTKVASGYAFQLATTVAGTDSGYYAHTVSREMSNAIGYTVEAQIKVISAGTTLGQVIWIYDGTFHYRFRLETDRIEASGGYFAEAETTYPMDTTDDFHIYRITTKGSLTRLYIDGIQRMAVTPDLASVISSRDVGFGDYTATADRGGDVYYAYVRYNIEGAYSPSERATDGWVFDKFDISESRRKSQFPIIRSDNVVLPKGNMNATKLKLGGTVAGTCYGSFRNAVRRLKRLLHSGMQKVYIDDERYLEAIHSNFTLKPETESYAKIKISMSAQNPYFESLYPEYWTTAPVSGGTWYITNNGDVSIPCKVIFTGSAAGTIDDSMKIENLTSTEECEYRGVIAATQELVIDKGFDDFNTYKIELDGSSVYNSYEGDMLTLQVGLNKFQYTGAAAGTIEMYWREGFVA